MKNLNTRFVRGLLRNQSVIIREPSGTKKTGAQVLRDITNISEKIKTINSQHIGIYGDHSIKSFELMLSCLYSGVPFFTLSSRDSDYKNEIKNEQLDNSLVINTTNKQITFCDNHIDFDSFISKKINNESKSTPMIEFEYDYIFFTSGTTGTPKPVLGKLETLEHFILNVKDKYNHLGDMESYPLVGFTFDAILRAYFLTLYSGGSVCLCSIEKGIETIANKKEHSNILIHSTPSILNRMTYLSSENHKHLNINLLVGGENPDKIKINDLASIFNLKNCYSIYGATEMTLGKAIKNLLENSSDRQSDIGEIFSEVQIYLDTDSQVIIATKFGSLGYANTKDNVGKFTSFPNGITHYQTGDKGRVDENGKLYIVGRTDNSVKHHGEIINLDFIEGKLHKKFNTEFSCLYDNNKLLIIYCGKKILKDEILSWMYENEFPLVNEIHNIDSMPLNTVGKSDKDKVLEIINCNTTLDDYENTETDISSHLAYLSEIWDLNYVDATKSPRELGIDSLGILMYHNYLNINNIDIQIEELLSKAVKDVIC